MPPQKSILSNTTMKVVRRIHLFAGLLLSPIVLIYAVSAFIFNHGAWFDGLTQEDSLVSEQVFSGTAISGIPSPEELAAAMIQKLNTRNGNENWVMTDETIPRYDRVLRVDGETPQGDVRIRLNLEEGGGTQEVRTESKSEELKGITLSDFGEKYLDEANQAAILEVAKRYLHEQGIELESIELDTLPSLRSSAESNGLYWDMRYDLEDGELTANPRRGGKSMRVSRTLTRIHTVHNYPDEMNIRWVWAVIVDLMVLLLLFWVFSGFMMWWQIKFVRRLGYILLSVGTVGTIVFYYLMQNNFLQ